MSTAESSTDRMPPLPRIRHHLNPRLKYTYICIETDGSVVIKTPYTLTKEETEALIRRKSSWIARMQRKQRSRFNNRFEGDNPHVYVWGSSLAVAYTKASETSLRIEERTAHFHAPGFCPDTLRRHLDTFYRQESERILRPMAEAYARRMRVQPQSVRFRKTKRQWGSCSPTNRISLNTMLAKVPIELAEYVVVHELAHIRHKHHQNAFWELVASIIPDYRKRRTELKHYTTY